MGASILKLLVVVCVCMVVLSSGIAVEKLNLTPYFVIAPKLVYIPRYVPRDADISFLKVDKNLLGELEGNHRKPSGARNFDVDADGVIYIPYGDDSEYVYLIDIFHTRASEWNSTIYKWKIEEMKRYGHVVSKVSIAPSGHIYVISRGPAYTFIFSPDRKLLHSCILGYTFDGDTIISKNGTVYMSEGCEIPTQVSEGFLRYNVTDVFKIESVEKRLVNGAHYAFVSFNDEEELKKKNRTSWAMVGRDKEGNVYVVVQEEDLEELKSISHGIPSPVKWSLWKREDKGKFRKLVEKENPGYRILDFTASIDGYIYALLEEFGSNYYIAKISMKDLKVQGLYNITASYPKNFPMDIKIADLKDARYIYVLDWLYPRLVVFREED